MITKIFWLVLLSTIILGSVAYFILHKTINIPYQPVVQKVQYSPKIEGWELYVDKKYNFEIEYPPGYILYKYSPPCMRSRDNETGTNVVIWNEDYIKSNNIFSKPVGDFSVFVDEPDRCIYDLSGDPETGKNYIYLDHQEDILVNGIRGIKRYYKNYEDPWWCKKNQPCRTKPSFVNYVLESGNHTFTLIYNNGLLTSDPVTAEAEFEKFVSTFRSIK